MKYHEPEPYPRQTTTLTNIYLINEMTNRPPTIFIQENFYVYMSTNLLIMNV